MFRQQNELYDEAFYPDPSVSNEGHTSLLSEWCGEEVDSGYKLD